MFSKNIILLILATSTFLNAQVQIEWLKSYGDYTVQSGYQTFKLNDMSIILIGITQGIENDYEEVLIVKIFTNGDIIFTRRIGKSRSIATPAICPTSDNGFVVSYSADNFDGNNYDIFILKFDSNVNLVWEKCYSSTENETVKSIKQTKEGFIMLGEYQILSQQGMDTELLLLKVDANGDSLWMRNISQIGSGKSIAVTPDNTYAFLGSFGDKVIKTNENGNELWNKEFKSNIKGNYIESTNDGGYIITGVTNSKLMLLKLNPDGNVDWIRQFGENVTSTGFCVKQVSDGGFIVTGQTTNNNGDTAIYIIKTNDSGTLDWSYMQNTEMPESAGLGEMTKLPIHVDDKNFIEEIFPGQYIMTGTIIDGFDWGVGLMKLTDLISINETNSNKFASNFNLLQNYPNPFNSWTNINIEVLQGSNIILKIFDLTGNIVKTLADEYKTAGYYNFNWNSKNNMGQSVSDGIYFYKLKTEDFTQTKKMLLLK